MNVDEITIITISIDISHGKVTLYIIRYKKTKYSEKPYNMTYSVSRYLYAVSFLLFSHSSAAQQLELDTFIQSILKNNPGVQRILAADAIAAGELEASQGIDDAILSSSLSLAHSEPNQVIGFEASESDDTQLKLSYDRLFSESGRRLSVALSDQHTNRDPAIGTIGSQYYQPSFTLRLTQPLMKNVGGIQDRLNIDLKQLNLKLTRLNNRESLESYITQLALLYIDWYLASRELEISKEVHQQSIAQEKLTRTKVRRQVVEPYELLRAQETREDYFSRWQQAEGRYAGLTEQIRYQMNLNGNASVETFVPADPKHAQLLTSQQAEIRSSNYLRSDSRLKEILDTLKTQQNMLLDAKTNAQDPDLDLSVGYSRHGISDNFSDAHLSELDRDDYSVMLEYKYPLGNRQASGDYQTQIASKKQVEADTEQRLLDAQAKLANLQAQVSQLFIALESTDRKIDFATKKIKKEKQLFNIGELDLFELLKDQTSQLESRLNREKLYTQLLTLRLNIGELLDRNLASYPITEK